ncbi:MAG: transporter substrate-binding domain-containing protein, partial [Microbacterium gubbeenense]
GNEELVTAMNESLAEMIDDGTYTEIFKEWFGEEPEWLDDLAASQD